ncbi:MAG: AAA family ATPase [Corynebacterium sp.]|uniref:AAA family ATPase n=1 Tax=Corynebacterium sp. TaxID=1720 RepID=UPI0026DC97F4|nr:AAA family ATPase [Corynebacterium sp.]MDO5098886.1 AAA family ATPase [Corynebacterium sp.]
MNKIIVAGVSGAGKSTLCKKIAALTGIDYTELDSLYHGPHWTVRESFMADVAEMVRRPSFVCEWQYPHARELLAANADVLIWLDFPYWRVVFPQLMYRTILRRLTGEPLWSGNHEPPLWRVFVDSDHVIRWSIKTRHDLGHLIKTTINKYPQLKVVRLKNHFETQRWLDSVIMKR